MVEHINDAGDRSANNSSLASGTWQDIAASSQEIDVRQVTPPSIEDAVDFLLDHHSQMTGNDSLIDLWDQPKSLDNTNIANGEHSLSIASLFKNRTLVGVQDHYWGPATKNGLAPESTISRKDLTSLKAALPSLGDPQMQARLNARSFLLDNYSSIATSDDGINPRMSRKELEKARSNFTSSSDRKMIDTVLQNYDEIKNSCNDDFLGESKISRMDAYFWLGSAGALDSMKKSMSTASVRLNDSLTAEASGDLHINSGNNSAAYLDAPLSQLSKEQVDSMISENASGSYTVVFPGEKDNPIIVDAPTDAQRAYNGSGFQQNIIERAMYKYGIQKGNRSYAPSAVGDVAAVTKLLTGKNVASIEPANLSEDNLHAILANGENGTFCTAEDGYDFQNAALKYDAEKKEVTINRFGHKEGSQSMSLSKFRNTYKTLSWASENAVISPVNAVDPWHELRD